MHGSDRHLPRRGMSISTGLTCALALAVAAASGDEDWRKLRDRQPAWQGPATRGVRMDPDALRGVGYDAAGVTMLAHLPLSEFNSTGNGNSCYGYVSPSGREYAIMGTSETTGYVEITDPLNPVVVANIPHTQSLWCDIKTHGHYAYTSNESGGGIQVIDLARIDEGIVTAIGNVTTSGLQTIHTLAVDNVSGFLYCAGSNLGSGALAAYSLADPANPTFAGRWTGNGARYTHESQILTYTTGPMAGRQIAYAFDGSSSLDVLDVTNKGQITRLSTLIYPFLQYCHQGWVSPDGHYLYINDELDEAVLEYPTRTRIIDVSNPAQPRYVGEFGNDLTSIDHNLYVRGNYIYESNYRTGLRVFDAHNPLAPVEVAHFDSYPEDDSAHFNGNWNNYPFFPSGTVVISDMERGMFVLDVDVARVQFSDPGIPTDTLIANSRNQIQINAEVAPSEPLPTDLTLHIAYDDGPFDALAMTRLIGTRYLGNVTPRNCGGTARYYFTAHNSLGREYTWPLGGEPEAYEARIVTGVRAREHMETVGAWTVPGSGSTASSGRWQNGAPEFTLAQPGEDHSRGPGVNCWATGLAAGSPTDPNANDVDGGMTTLVSPAFNTLAPETYVSYWRFYSNNTGNAPGTDAFRVDISTNNGATWTNIETVRTETDQMGAWVYKQFRIADFAPPGAMTRFRFVAEDAGAPSAVEAALDDLNVVMLDCPPEPACRCDWNARDGLDSQDYFEFLDQFFSGSADYNGVDGTDSQDYFEFLECFFEGCGL